ncbi:hypothetical protein LDENG_00117300 [Lucifuga dentata]|nr:hypothetical protein LDENG_00117300 [Lucifuga dentata]
MASPNTNTETNSFEECNLKILPGNSCQYRKLESIGSGSFGAVFRCTRGNTPETVAVKMIYDDEADTARTEAKIMKKLRILESDKYNIVRFIEHFEHKEHNYLVYEMLDQNLCDFIADRGGLPLNLQSIQVVTEQMLVALKALSRLGIIHTDIKPDNIMLVNHEMKPFKVKLIDFGNACQVSKTKTGMDIQAIGYRAPEISLGFPLTEAIDMWSLGCVMAYLFLGNHLYPTDCQYSMMKRTVIMQGFPDAQLLNDGEYTKDFFSWISSWFTCLDDMKKFRPLQMDIQKDKELEAFLSLLKRILHLNPKKRLTPSEALRHRFITMTHLHHANKSWFRNSCPLHDSVVQLPAFVTTSEAFSDDDTYFTSASLDDGPLHTSSYYDSSSTDTQSIPSDTASYCDETSLVTISNNDVNETSTSAATGFDNGSSSSPKSGESNNLTMSPSEGALSLTVSGSDNEPSSPKCGESDSLTMSSSEGALSLTVSGSDNEPSSPKDGESANLMIRSSETVIGPYNGPSSPKYGESTNSMMCERALPLTVISCYNGSSSPKYGESVKLMMVSSERALPVTVVDYYNGPSSHGESASLMMRSSERALPVTVVDYYNEPSSPKYGESAILMMRSSETVIDSYNRPSSPKDRDSCLMMKSNERALPVTVVDYYNEPSSPKYGESASLMMCERGLPLTVIDSYNGSSSPKYGESFKLMMRSSERALPLTAIGSYNGPPSPKYGKSDSLMMNGYIKATTTAQSSGQFVSRMMCSNKKASTITGSSEEALALADNGSDNGSSTTANLNKEELPSGDAEVTTRKKRLKSTDNFFSGTNGSNNKATTGSNEEALALAATGSGPSATSNLKKGELPSGVEVKTRRKRLKRTDNFFSGTNGSNNKATIGSNEEALALAATGSGSSATANLKKGELPSGFVEVKSRRKILKRIGNFFSRINFLSNGPSATANLKKEELPSGFAEVKSRRTILKRIGNFFSKIKIPGNGPAATADLKKKELPSGFIEVKCRRTILRRIGNFFSPR